MKFDYKSSGVDIEKANSLVDYYKECGEKTKRPGVLGSIGGFGGLFKLDVGEMKNPILVSSTDGVGTKLDLAIKYNKHEVVGQDLVGMCVNDIITCGAQPLFFLDYLATGKLEEETIKDLLLGVSDACVEVECALMGGETAEMPGFYPKGKYDVAGFCVGVVDQDKIIDGSKCSEGDIVLGLKSNGIHSNGFSLVRKLLEHYPELNEQMNDIMKPTKLYWKTVKALLNTNVEISAMAHITGGGILENIPRVIPKNLDCIIEENSWDIPNIFTQMQRLGNIDREEMFRTFNMGIGYILIVPEQYQRTVETVLVKENVDYNKIGYLKRSNNEHQQEAQVKII
ncbi:phosphoribosylformylglycinamidine cyclo-ligase [Alkalicella caledoniensis]|uniref:Phosphoribosylformylglycinamidine cyclo-ligase n=1 Tax=Alkalicella caledoniensis TaxID=2731377 RepID=A0A7G9W989_ALKCA|nr:phosphoribosylformylglycinamidine cyclo-ligase [Alkalicella caledoniensis]QNO15251.1 phosphoribosylformylglycinamidine cyclo-ligase [Alkalicella caledoniensis]